MSLAEAVTLGVVEGATEFLPVSSTGHLIIAQELLEIGGGEEAEEADAAHSLAICIQIGAILAVLLLYWNRIRQLLRGLLGGDAAGRRLLIALIVAFLPVAITGLAFRDTIKEYLFGTGPVAAALLVGGILILLMEAMPSRRLAQPGMPLEDLSWRGALLIGVCQCAALWPGFSRSLATIIGARIAGLRLDAAVEFSFLLGLVTLSAATVFEGMKSGSAIFDAYGVFTPAVAVLTAFVAAAVSIKWMIHFLTRHGLSVFGYYRIVLATLLLLLL